MINKDSRGTIMKYKILVSGHNQALVKDFLYCSDDSNLVESISTSDHLNDTAAHFELFHPDAYMFILDSADRKTLSAIKHLRAVEKYKDIKVVLVAHKHVFKEIDSICPGIADLFVLLPVSSDNIILKVHRFLEEAEIEPGTGRIKNQDKKDVLIIDDDKTILKVLKTALEDEYNVTTMSNSLLAEKFLESKHADLIILDYSMPERTGTEVYSDLKKNEEYADIPVCFLTGTTDRNQIQEIMDLQPHAYLIKPINMKMIKTTIRNIID